MMAAIFPTPPDRLTDPQGRPYFLWDCNLSLTDLRRLLNDSDADVRNAMLAKVMRQAKPDDVLLFVTRGELARRIDELAPFLGDKEPFWRFWAAQWLHLGPDG